MEVRIAGRWWHDAEKNRYRDLHPLRPALECECEGAGESIYLSTLRERRRRDGAQKTPPPTEEQLAKIRSLADGRSKKAIALETGVSNWWR